MPDVRLDPFSLVYNGLWELVERNRNLDSYIPKGNRVKYENDNEIKTATNQADTPELALLSGGGSFGGANNSSQKSCLREYIWALTSGDLRLNPIFNPIQWELFRSMSDWECVLCNLQWCNCRFVENCNLISAEDSPISQSLDRDVPGWSSLWIVQVSFQFPTVSLKIKE